MMNAQQTQSGRGRPIYRGWIMIGTLAITEMVSWGITYYAFSVLMTPMSQELSWTPTQLTGAFSLGLLIAGFSDMWVGRWLDAHGPRLLMTFGSLCAVLLVFAWSRVQSLPGLYAVWFGIGLAGPMIQYGPAFWVATRWFRRKRGAALTLITLGGGFASTVFIPLTHTFEAAWGWRTALIGMAGILAVITIAPHALVLRRSPEDVGLLADGDGASPVAVSINVDRRSGVGDVLRRKQFWFLAVAFALSNITFTGMSVHLVSYELSRGQDPGFAAWAAGFVGVMQVVGRLLLAPLSDRIPRPVIAVVLFLCQAVSLLALLLLPLNIGLITHAVFRGIGNGTLTPIRAALIADSFGTERYGGISGAMSFFTGFAGAASPVAVGALAGSLGYAPVLWMFAGMAIVAGALIGATGRQEMAQ